MGIWGGLLRGDQHDKTGPNKAVQQSALRSHACENPNSHDEAEQMAGQVVGGLRFRNLAGRLSSLDAEPKPRLGFYQEIRDNLLNLWVMRCNLKSRIDHQASLALGIVQRKVDNFFEERSDHLQRRQLHLGACPEFFGAMLDIIIQ